MAKKDNNKKDINDVLEASSNIHSRLFNHKHFIDGEINYLINKTEKNECKDIDQILNQIQDQHQAKLAQMNENKNLIDLDKLKRFSMKAEELLKKSNEILDLDDLNRIKRKSKNEEYSKCYRLKDEQIKLANQTKFENVDKYYERKKIEVAKYYHELESKWDI